MRQVRLMVLGFILSLVICMHAQAAKDDSGELVDEIKIISITPNDYSFTEPYTFTVYVEYALRTKEQGIVYLGFNTETATSYTLSTSESASVIVSRGTGKIALSETVLPINWKEPSRLAGFWLNGYTGSKVITDFMVYVNLSEYPHESSWVPLATDEAVIRELPEGNSADLLQCPIEKEVTIDHLGGSSVVKWGSTLFEQSSTQFSWELAKLSSVLCAAAEMSDEYIEISEAIDKFARQGIVPESEKLEAIKWKGTNIENAYLNMGFNEDSIALFSYPISRFNQNNAYRNMDNYYARDRDLAFSIASIPVEIDGDEIHLVVIVVKGSQTIGEFAGDMFTSAQHDFHGYLAYDLVYEFEEDIRQALIDYFEAHEELWEGRIKFLVTGHSLGGAAANLIAAFLTKYSSGSWAAKEDIYCYTFGAIDSIKSLSSIEEGFENIHNIFNYYDTYGPYGGRYVLTAKGNTMFAKFGHIDLFAKDFRTSETGWLDSENHLIGHYAQAMLEEIKIEKDKTELLKKTMATLYKNLETLLAGVR